MLAWEEQSFPNITFASRKKVFITKVDFIAFSDG